ncbi:hypothetical protein NDU88_003947 [Pleurodeles waltl]|uniref:Secreted protein n=1 Tax=Pleurodeles waltl TaxID=8319 RepID=A0AAV7W3K9_PLEWA|nr:hypothetical protein NDU88_003947 [Pleurodeles waltl]
MAAEGVRLQLLRVIGSLLACSPGEMGARMHLLTWVTHRLVANVMRRDAKRLLLYVGPIRHINQTATRPNTLLVLKDEGLAPLNFISSTPDTV